MRRLVVALVVALALGGLVPSAPANEARSPGGSESGIRLERAGPRPTGPLSVAAARAIRSGARPVDRAAHARAKAAAAREAGLRSTPRASAAGPATAAVSPTPTVPLKKNGIFDTTGTPPDTTGAIGTTRYIEVVNRKVGLYDRSLTLLAQTDLNTWYSAAFANSFDPQVIWDPTTARFYYAGDAVFSDTAHLLTFGWSKTATPTDFTTSWCKYNIDYGAEFPDYPKLGDSRDFAIIGANIFDAADNFIRPEILAIGKPPAGTTCPAAEDIPFGIGQDPTVGGVGQFTPVPANEIDSNSTGWVLTRSEALPSTKLGLFKVTRHPTTGDPVIQTSGQSISVPAYTVPPNAPQKDSTFLLDTLDSRLTQAVAAIDPDHGGVLHIWTQHTVDGGAGTRVRWYEIDPATRTLAQTGAISHSSLFLFNAAISPDRVVNGGTKAFGSNMIVGYNTSSSATYPGISMRGKRGADSISSTRVVKTSPGHDADFGCQFSVCRWGDYAAATPDPAASTGNPTGQVWLSNQWTLDADTTGGTAGVSWRTLNWIGVP